MPRPTTNGSGIFACKVDGTVFTPKSNDFKRGATDVKIFNKSIYIFASRSTETESSVIQLIVKDFKGKNTYVLDNDSTSIGYYSSSSTFFTNSNNTGKLVITNYDVNNSILSGTFEFSAISKTTSKVVKVSEGRFDLTF